MNPKFRDGFEARLWLGRNGHESALASNRFDSTQAAERSVNLLCEYGAKRVFIDPDTIISDEEEMEVGGEYADAIVIEIENGTVSDELRNVYLKEAGLQGYHPKSETLSVIEGKYLYLWWD